MCFVTPCQWIDSVSVYKDFNFSPAEKISFASQHKPVPLKSTHTALNQEMRHTPERTSLRTQQVHNLHTILRLQPKYDQRRIQKLIIFVARLNRAEYAVERKQQEEEK